MVLPIYKSLFSSSYLRRSNPSYSFFSTVTKSDSGISIYDFLVNQHHFPADIAAKASDVADGKYLRNPKNADSVLSYLNEAGFSRSQIETILQKTPRILASNVNNFIKPKIQLFSDSGFPPKDVAKIITGDPWIITRNSANRLAPSIEALKTVIGSVSGVSALLQRSTWFLKNNLNAKTLPTIEYIHSLGFTHEHVLTLMSRLPRLFLVKPEVVKQSARKVEEEMGLDKQCAMFLCAVEVVCSVGPEKWEEKVNLLKEFGFSDEDIGFAFKRDPRIFANSAENVKQTIELLVSEAGIEMSSIVKNPELLNCSIEKCIKPRMEVVKALQMKNLLPGDRKPNMVSVLKTKREYFLKKYVHPYSDQVEGLLQIAEGYHNVE
ncbi:Transcription termination factor MTERF2, chloroplastic [Linum perenne]